MKVCPKCGRTGESNFCQDCGTMMEDVKVEECIEVTNNDAPEEMIEQTEENTEEATQEIVSEPTEMAEQSLPKEKKKKNVKKIIKITAIVIAAIIVAFLALGCIVSMTTPDLAEEESMEDYQLIGMEYDMPVSWEAHRSDESETLDRYVKRDDGVIIAVAEVRYAGENDLDTGDAAYVDEHYVSDEAESILPECAGTYDEVIAGTSVFEITVYAVEGDVRGEDEFLSMVAESFDIDNYKNTRVSKGIVAEYTGSTAAGVTIDSDCEDITVEESFETVLGVGTKELDWTIDVPVTLKAGETSSVAIKIGEKTQTLTVECSTMSEAQYKAKCVARDYKSQLRSESYDVYIKIYGQVLQDCGSGYFRISSSGGYDNVYMVYAPDSDIVEDDWVTVYGVTDGIYTYETVMGATKKIPSIDAKYVDR